MTDWPSDRYHKNVISSWSVEGLGVSISALSTSVPASVAWPTANLARFMPFAIGAPYLVRKVWWLNGATVAGNVDCGVYSWDGTLLLSAGSTAQASASLVQSVDTTDYLLLPGSYYFALAMSSTSATVWVAGANARDIQMMGMAQQATALPLPAAATFATASGSSVPCCGITNGTVL